LSILNLALQKAYTSNYKMASSTNICIIENNIIATNTIREKLTQTLMQRGYNVTVLTSGMAEEIAVARAKGFNIVNVGTSAQNPFTIFNYIINLYKHIKDSKANVVLTFTIRPAIWGNLVTKALNIPTLTNITGIGPLFEKNNFGYRSARAIYKFMLSKTARVFFQNNDDMNLFLEKKFVKKERIIRIPGSGVDHTKYQPQPKTRVDEKFQFLYIGRLVKDKGIAILKA
jgi:glycosyltransferase involved in cell wall biosynthesis